MTSQTSNHRVRPPWLIWSIAAAVAATVMMSAVPIVFRQVHDAPLPPRWSVLGWWTAGIVVCCCLLGTWIWKWGKRLERSDAQGRAMIATLMGTLMGLAAPILIALYGLLLLISV
jgi:hypothetical protein